MTYSLGNISTTQFYDRAKGRMGALSAQADALQTAISNQPNRQGRLGPGASSHCAHGVGGDALREYLDWRPYCYFTNRFTPLGRGPHFFRGIETFEFIPTDVGTRVQYRFRLEDRGPLTRLPLGRLALSGGRLLGRGFSAVGGSAVGGSAGGLLLAIAPAASAATSLVRCCSRLSVGARRDFCGGLVDGQRFNF